MKTLVNVWKDHKMACLTLLLVACLIPAAAFGWTTAPASGTFGYEFYNFMVTTMLQGPIGRIIGMGMAVGGFVIAIFPRLGGWMVGLPLMGIAGILYNLENVASALGWIV